MHHEEAMILPCNGASLGFALNSLSSRTQHAPGKILMTRIWKVLNDHSGRVRKTSPISTYKPSGEVAEVDGGHGEVDAHAIVAVPLFTSNVHALACLKED